VALHWSASEVAVSVENEVTGTLTAAPLSGSGGGYGLRGIAERLELLGGSVSSGPTPGAWRVDARVPLVEGTPVASEPGQNGFPGRRAEQAAS
jgi:signal transduction histidine kinase